MDKSTEDFMLKIFGIKDPDAYREKYKNDYKDYCHLIGTMTQEEVLGEIAKEFGSNPKHVALIGMIYLTAMRKC